MNGGGPSRESASSIHRCTSGSAIRAFHASSCFSTAAWPSTLCAEFHQVQQCPRRVHNLLLIARPRILPNRRVQRRERPWTSAALAHLRGRHGVDRQTRLYHRDPEFRADPRPSTSFWSFSNCPSGKSKIFFACSGSLKSGPIPSRRCRCRTPPPTSSPPAQIHSPVSDHCPPRQGLLPQIPLQVIPLARIPPFPLCARRIIKLAPTWIIGSSFSSSAVGCGPLSNAATTSSISACVGLARSCPACPRSPPAA